MAHYCARTPAPRPFAPLPSPAPHTPPSRAPLSPQAVLETSSNLLRRDKAVSWTDLPQSTQARAATRMVSSLEGSAFLLADTLPVDSVKFEFNLNIGEWTRRSTRSAVVVALS